MFKFFFSSYNNKKPSQNLIKHFITHILNIVKIFYKLLSKNLKMKLVLGTVIFTIILSLNGFSTSSSIAATKYMSTKTTNKDINNFTVNTTTTETSNWPFTFDKNDDDYDYDMAIADHHQEPHDSLSSAFITNDYQNY